MARNLVYMGRWDVNRYSNDIPKWRLRVKDIRTKFSNALSSTSWLVSDVMEHLGISGNLLGASFIIRHLNSSTPTGKEWWIHFTKPSIFNESAPPFVIGNNNATIIDDYFINNNNTTIFSSNSGGPFLHYNNEARHGTDVLTCEYNVTFTGTPTVSELMKQTSPATNEKQATVVAFTDLGGGSGTIKLRMKRGAKINTGDVFSQTPTASTITIGTVIYEALYDMAFDDWDTGRYATPLTASGGSGTYTDIETVTGSLSGATGTFRRESGGIVYIVRDNATPFQVNDVLTGGSSGATRTVTAVGDPDNTIAPNAPISSRSPYANLVGFMPRETRLLGRIRFAEGPAGFPSLYWFVLDDQKPFMCCYSSFGFAYTSLFTTIQGEVITPYLTTDTYTSAAITFNMNTDYDEAGTITTKRIDGYGGDVNPGVRTTFTDRAHDIFTIDNTPRETDGLYGWDLVNLDNTDEFKGYLDSAVFRVAGAVNEHFGLLTSGPDGPFLKCSRNIMFPWVQDEPVIFSPRWGSEPSDSLF